MKSLNKFSLAFVVLLNCNILLSQSQSSGDLDEAYLQSLPEVVREDILKEIDKESNDDGQIRRGPSVKLQKIEIVKKWEEFLKAEADLELTERYGLKLFRTMQSSFMPINEPNFDSTYILDVGDELELQFLGQSNSVSNHLIKRNGSISIPRVGNIYVAGLSLENAVNQIQGKIKEVLIGVDTLVSLTNIRDIQILITGNVPFPGLYTLNGNSNAIHALSMAGGVSENGSLRSVYVKRNGNVITEIDFYESLILGNISYNNRLRSGDVIFVNPANNIVRAGGGFNKEGLFEMKGNETFEDFLKFVGGFSKDIISKEITLSRYGNEGYKTTSQNLSTIKNLVLMNNDNIFITEYALGVVDIKGEVLNPGKYSISGNESLSDLVDRAGGYTTNAYEFGGVLHNKRAAQIETNSNEKLYAELIKYLAGGAGGAGALDSQSLPIILNELKQSTSSGRVIVEFDLEKIRQNPSLDTILRDGDEIIVPKFDKSVYVHGELVRPGAVMFSSSNKISDYINASGGYSRFSNKKQVIIIDPNGKVRKASASLNILSNLSNHEIYPGSVIYVPRDIGRRDNLSLASTIAPIFSSLALSVASVNALDN